MRGPRVSAVGNPLASDVSDSHPPHTTAPRTLEARCPFRVENMGAELVRKRGVLYSQGTYVPLAREPAMRPMPAPWEAHT